MKKSSAGYVVLSLLLLMAACKNQPASPANGGNTTTTVDSNGNVVVEKFGYINSLELLSIMPESKAADLKLEQTAKRKEGSFQSLAQSYQKKVNEFQQLGDVLTQSDQEKRVKEIQGIEQKLQQMQATAQSEIAMEKEKLYAPIFARADSAIKWVAKEYGYTFIFDSPSLLYADSTRNILPLVKEYLGIKDTEETTEEKKP